MTLSGLEQFSQYKKHKESGIDWAEKIPDDWEVKKLKYVAYLASGETIKPESFCGDGYPVYGGNGFRGYTSRFTNDGNYALIGRQGALCGNVNYATGKFFASEHAIVVYPFGGYEVYWLGEVIKQADFNRLSQASAQPGIAVNVIKEQLLPVPSSVEIRKIANFLDKKTAQIDEAIAIKEQQIALLKERQQIIIQQAVTRGLDPDVPMKDSGVDWIGETPAHWEVYANRTLFSERVEPGRDGVPLLSVSIHTGVSSEELSDEDNIRGRIKIEDKSKYVLVKQGDIAYNMMRAWQGGIGAVKCEGMVSPAYVVAEPSLKVDGAYFEHQYRCPEFIQQMDRFSKGITDFRKRLYWDSFKQLLTVVPPLREQKEIVEQIRVERLKADESVKLFEEQIQKLKEYKTTLINSAVTGKIKVA